MRNVLALIIGLVMFGGLATAPSFAEDDRPDQIDVDNICRSIADVCQAVCDGKFEINTINWNLCSSACDGDQRICNGSSGGAIALQPISKSLKQSRPVGRK